MIKVFIADDQQLIIDDMKCLIDWEAYGFSITCEANDGLDAWRKICELKPDIVFTDIVMPGLDGIELLKKIKQNNLSAEVVMLTGHADFNYAKASCKHGAFDYLLKPLGEDELLDTLERFKEKYIVMNDLDEGSGDENPGTSKTSAHLAASQSKTLKLFVKYVEDNYYKTMNLYEIAENFHFNASYISQLFKKELGISFSEYVTRVRMDIAENLLKTSRIPVKSIQTKVGINDYYYFIRLFKKYKGVTPHQMQNKYETPQV